MSFLRTKMPVRRGPSYAVLSVVALARDVDAEGGVIPKSTRGTIVHAYRDGSAFEVEFDHPFQAVMTLVPTDLTA